MLRFLVLVPLLVAGCAAPMASSVSPATTIPAAPTIAPAATPLNQPDVRAIAIAAAATANAQLATPRPTSAPATVTPAPAPATPTEVPFVAAPVVSVKIRPTDPPLTRAFAVAFTGSEGTRFDGSCLRLQPNGASSSQSWKGIVPASFALGDAWRVSCAATKVLSRGKTLTLKLLGDGVVLQTGNTDAPNGLIEVTSGV